MAPSLTPRQILVVPEVAVAALAQFLSVRPRTLALLGGTTPRRFYRLLAECTFHWAGTDVFVVDERLGV